MSARHYPFADDPYGSGSMYCWWFRWHGITRCVGKWVVSAAWFGNVFAVMDDFGNLVQVSQ